MKDKEVCIGCRYRMTKVQLAGMEGACNYADITGKSRLVIEMANGGYKKDKCVCYEKGRRKRKQPEKMILTEPKGEETWQKRHLEQKWRIYTLSMRKSAER